MKLWHFATDAALSVCMRSARVLLAGSLLWIGCAGQFELDVPDEHPARATAKTVPIEAPPSPYDQRYPTNADPEQRWDEDETPSPEMQSDSAMGGSE